jgi:aminomethyltransferase
MAAGAPFGLKPGHTSSIRRIEGGMLSYHADADNKTNPYELGLDRLVNLDIEANFIGKAALRRIKEQGASRKQVGLILDGEPMPGPNTSFWAIKKDGMTIGKVTSAIYSPRLEMNIALAMVSTEHAILGAKVKIVNKSGIVNEAGTVTATIVERPFYDPNKKIAAA